jgi:hypothetical protein
LCCGRRTNERRELTCERNREDCRDRPTETNTTRSHRVTRQRVNAIGTSAQLTSSSRHAQLIRLPEHKFFENRWFSCGPHANPQHRIAVARNRATEHAIEFWRAL